jgi:hypothetical protein
MTTTTTMNSAAFTNQRTFPMFPSPQRIPSKIVLYSRTAFGADIDALKVSWRKLQRCRERDGVYKFLSEVFELVSWWLSIKRIKVKAFERLERNMEDNADMEPFARAIIEAALPTKLDKRTVSKWSRVLRMAHKFKPRDLSLKKFVKRHGGLNACASEYGRRPGRLAKDA